MTRDEKEKRILDAALKLFARYGYKKTTLEDVAAAADMTKSNIYFYVKDKRDLYEKTVGNALSQWRDVVSDAVNAESDVVNKFRVMATGSFEYLIRHSDLRAILVNDPGIFSLTPGEDRFYEINRGAVRIIFDILKMGVSRKVFYPVDIHHMSEFLFSVYIMFLIRTYVKSEGRSAAKMYEEGLNLAIRGLCSRDYNRRPDDGHPK